jgi:hypothetical protein
MSLDRNRLYSILAIACTAGYIWLFYGLHVNQPKKKHVEVCFIKHFTNIPCPSCGSTRSVISLTKGHFKEALEINPLGYIIAIIMLLAPLWMIIDIANKRETLFEFYRKIEHCLNRPQYAIALILAVVIIWILNILKGL